MPAPIGSVPGLTPAGRDQCGRGLPDARRVPSVHSRSLDGPLSIQTSDRCGVWGRILGTRHRITLMKFCHEIPYVELRKKQIFTRALQ